MNVVTRLLGFAAVLAVAFTAALLLGQVVGPVDDSPSSPAPPASPAVQHPATSTTHPH